MKKPALISVLLFYFSFSLAQVQKNMLVPQVDKRIELASIACRLANINGFSGNSNSFYSNEITKHFNQFSNHPFIQYLVSLKERLDTAYWEIQALAVHISQPPALAPLIRYTDTGWVDMWEDRSLFNEKTVLLIQQFYKDARCAAFFQSQEKYYKAIQQQYKKTAVAINDTWLANFFELSTTENYYPILALSMNNSAYMRVNFKNRHKDTYTIFTSDSFDKNGMPGNFANTIYQRSMLHEYIHAFTNQLIDNNSTELQDYAETILKQPAIFKLVENTFYGNWQYLLYESLVRACAIKYMASNGESKAGIENEMIKEETAGFVWIRGLIRELDNYENNREKYKSLDLFMPQINIFFRKTAGEIANGTIILQKNKCVRLQVTKY